LTKIIAFLARWFTLLWSLLDELGGAPILPRDALRARCWKPSSAARRIFVATHYPELQLYAHDTPLRNASMEFNVETLAPTYHLTIGLPGRSNAFAIARRLGLSEVIIKQAQGMISGEELRAEDMLDDLHNLRLQQAQARDDARRAAGEAATLESQLRARLAKIEEERRDISQRAEIIAQEELEALRDEVRALRSRMLSARRCARPRRC
jgi:DNA mismatch repair protein MutS2